MNFVAIDFETANNNRSSACSLGLAKVRNGQIKETRSYLIRPEPLQFNPWNTKIHGITKEDVVNQPTFLEYWDEIKRYLNDEMVVAHNTGFDMSVLRNVLDLYNIKHPYFHFLCTYKIASRTWPELPSHKLNIISDMLDIDLNHHHALDDSVACAKILIQAMLENNCTDVDELASVLLIGHGSFNPHSGYKPCRVY